MIDNIIRDIRDISLKQILLLAVVVLMLPPLGFGLACFSIEHSINSRISYMQTEIQRIDFSINENHINPTSIEKSDNFFEKRYYDMSNNLVAIDYYSGVNDSSGGIECTLRQRKYFDKNDNIIARDVFKNDKSGRRKIRDFYNSNNDIFFYEEYDEYGIGYNKSVQTIFNKKQLKMNKHESPFPVLFVYIYK